MGLLLLQNKHISYFIHITIWIIYLFLPQLIFDQPLINKYLYQRLFLFPFYIVLFYSNLYYLLPKYFLKQKFVQYTLLLIGVAILLYILETFLYAVFDIAELIQSRHKKPKLYFIVMNSLFMLTVSMSIGIYNSWYKNEKKRQLAEQEKLQAELAYLKSQINPHFLFNSLNNIFSLANDKSDHAPEAIVKLSSLLRYMLYQAKKEMVLLEEEISHIRNYIDLQKLRLFDEIEISLTIKGDIKKHSIEPLLLIPFVENTFKHGVSYQQASTISIEIEISGGTLKLVTINPIVHEKSNTQKRNKGIGLENVKRRLELLYAGSYTLNINTDNGTYKSELLIWLK